MNAGGFYAAKRFALGCVLAWVLWSLAGTLVGFTNVVVNSSPTPASSAVCVQFGVIVDGNRSIFEVSRLCPVGTALPAPEKLLLVR